MNHNLPSMGSALVVVVWVVVWVSSRSVVWFFVFAWVVFAIILVLVRVRVWVRGVWVGSVWVGRVWVCGVSVWVDWKNSKILLEICTNKCCRNEVYFNEENTYELVSFLLMDHFHRRWVEIPMMGLELGLGCLIQLAIVVVVVVRRLGRRIRRQPIKRR